MKNKYFSVRVLFSAVLSSKINDPQFTYRNGKLRVRHSHLQVLQILLQLRSFISSSVIASNTLICVYATTSRAVHGEKQPHCVLKWIHFAQQNDIFFFGINKWHFVGNTLTLMKKRKYLKQKLCPTRAKPNVQ